VGAVYGLRMATAELEAEVVAIPNTTDAATLSTLYDASAVERNQIAEVTLRCTKPLAGDVDGGCADTKRFVLLDGYDIAGGGQLGTLEPLPREGRRAVEFIDDFDWKGQQIEAEQWRARHGHGPAVVLLVGEKGVGKADLAGRLQQRLFADGINAALVDADNVLAAAPQDTSLDTARELLQTQFERTIAPLLGAGLVVVATSNAIGLADHGWLTEGATVPTLCVLMSPDRNARLVDADVQVYGAVAIDKTLERLSTEVAARVK